MQRVYQSIESQGELSVSNCRKVVFAIVALAIIIFIIYGNSFDCSWHFDDEPNITDNPLLHMTKISWHSIKSAVFSDRNNPAMPYRPVACLSFALNYYFGELDVFGYHMVNIFIHLISSIFLFLFIYHTLNLPSLKTKYTTHSYSIALLATILWTINPIQTQAVTYIVQRMASLAAMFYIVGMYFFLRARTDLLKSKKIFFFALCGISFLLALGSKENAAMLPLSLLLYEMLILQEDPPHFFRKNLFKLTIVLGLALFIGLAYLYIKSGSPLSVLINGYENRPFTMGQRLLTEPRIILLYVSLLFYPMPNRLNIAHDITISTSLLHPFSTLLSLLIIAGSIAGTLLLSRKRPFIVFSILFFFLNHLIESSIFPLELVFEHRNYLPSMFLFVPVAMGLHYLLDTFATKKAMEFILSSFLILVLIGLGHSTFMRNFTWKNEKSLWIDAVEKSPNMFRPHHNLAKYYQDHGCPKKAIEEYEKGLASPVIVRKSEVVVTYYNLGKIYSDMNALNKAIYSYQSALKLDPLFFPALCSLASTYDRKGLASRANYYLQKAVQLNPYDPLVNFNLGLYYLKKRVPEKAIYCFNHAASNEILSRDCLFYLGIAYKQKNENGRAATFFQKAINNHAKLVDSHLNLAEIYAKTSRPELASEETRKALDLMSKSQKIFHESINRIFSDKKDFEALQPSKSILLPLLFRSINTKNQEFRIMKEYLLGKVVKNTRNDRKRKRAN